MKAAIAPVQRPGDAKLLAIVTPFRIKNARMVRGSGLSSDPCRPIRTPVQALRPHGPP